jgi:hypothetical protein
MIVIINIITNENNHFTFQCNGQHKWTKHTIVFPIEVGWGDYTIDFDEGTNVKLQHAQAM